MKFVKVRELKIGALFFFDGRMWIRSYYDRRRKKYLIVLYRNRSIDDYVHGNLLVNQ